MKQYKLPSIILSAIIIFSAFFSQAFAIDGVGGFSGGSPLRNIVQQFFPMLGSSSQPLNNTTSSFPLGDDSEMRGNRIFCTRIDNVKTQLESGIVERETAITKKRMATEKEETEKKATEEMAAMTRRTAWDTNFEKGFTQLSLRAKTQTQKTAIEKFRSVVERAIHDRRIATDKIINSFKTENARAAQVRKNDADKALALYKIATKAAGAKAKTDCATVGVSVATARNTYNASMKAAKDKFEADKKAIEANVLSVKNLSEEKKAAIEKINADFKMKVEAALKELKRVFPDA